MAPVQLPRAEERRRGSVSFLFFWSLLEILGSRKKVCFSRGRETELIIRSFELKGYKSTYKVYISRVNVEELTQILSFHFSDFKNFELLIGF